MRQLIKWYMHKPNKCIIDNWSLEHAGLLLESSNDLGQKNNDSLVKNIGGLSNFINAILLYEESFFIMNGFEKDWKRFNWFDTNTSAFINGIQLDELTINWESPSSYEDKGIRNYLFSSRYFESDLLICPERSEIDSNNRKLDNAFVDTLKEIDKKIQLERDSSAFNKIKMGIDRNFQFPLITQYVLSEATTRDDLLTVIMQLKSDGKIARVINKIEEVTATSNGAGKFERDIQYLIKEAFGRQTDNQNELSISVSAYFLSISKSVNLNFFRRAEHLVFLKNLIACRSEAYRLEKDIQRIFKRKVKP
jgi:hypothetical protein